MWQFVVVNSHVSPLMRKTEMLIKLSRRLCQPMEVLNSQRDHSRRCWLCSLGADQDTGSLFTTSPSCLHSMIEVDTAILQMSQLAMVVWLFSLSPRVFTENKHPFDPHSDGLWTHQWQDIKIFSSCCNNLSKLGWNFFQKLIKALLCNSSNKRNLSLQHQPYIPSFIPPNCLKPSGLQGCHNDIYIIVPISQHALLVRCHQSAGRKPATSCGETTTDYPQHFMTTR